MSTSISTSSETAANRLDSFKGYNSQLSDARFSENSDTSVSNCDNIKRYSRSKLFELRNDSYSRRRLEANLQSELQSLGVWKYFNCSNVYQNGVSANNEGATVTGSSCGGSQSLKISSTNLNVRSQRSPSRRESNTAVHISNSSQHNLPHHSLHKTCIDHRSISSSHLMPAFAKRRIAAPSTTSNVTGMVLQNLLGSGNSSYAPSSPIDTSSQTPITDVKDGILYNSIAAGKNSHMRHRTKDKSYDYRQGGCNAGSNDGDAHPLLLSPSRKVSAENDCDREQELQSNNGRPSSPVSLASSRHNHKTVGITHERRIGSGRLLPRDVSWDYRTAQDRDKGQNLNSICASDKDSLPSNHIGQTRTGSRYSDRSHERTAGGNGRRSGGCDDNLRDKYEHSINTQSPNTLGSVIRRDIYGPELSSNQHTTSHVRNRRNHQYSDRNEEPEWFSSGPTSQHDTIELRGFEEIDDHYNASTTESTGSYKRSSLSASSRKISEISLTCTSSSLNLSSKEQRGSLDHDKEENSMLNISPTSLTTSNNTENVDFLNEEEKNGSFKVIVGDSNNNNSSENTPRNIDRILPDFLMEKDVSTPKISNNSRTNTKDSEFNFDVFLNPNLDPLKHSLMRGDTSKGNENEIMGSSRFSRWFANKNGSNDVQTSAVRNHDNINAVELVQDTSANKGTNTLMEFLTKLPVVPDSSVSQKVTTIPSVGELEARMRCMNTGNGALMGSPVTSSEMQNTKQQERELEIVLPIGNDQFNSGQPQAGEIEAFKKLLEQLGSGNKPEHTQPQHHLLSNMQKSVLISPQNRNTLVPSLNTAQPGNIMASAHMSQQMLANSDELKKEIHPQAFHPQHQNIGELSNISHSQHQNLSIVFANQPQKRVEARNLYQCITRGEISINFLEQEMNNPNASLYAKEVIAAVLRETHCHPLTTSVPGPVGHQQDHSPKQLCSSNATPITSQALPNQSHEPLQKQKLSQHIPNSNAILPGQTERISHLPPHQSANHQVIPRQREFQFHPQTIMQNAMLKKKIEEQQQQQDSLRRRQEIQRQAQPNMLSGLTEIDIQLKNIQIPIPTSLQQQTVTPQQIHISHTMHQQHQPSRHINSPTPLAFTPTSVLRKMTAEKDNLNPNTAPHSCTNSVRQQQNKPSLQTQNTQQQMQQQPITTQPRMILGGSNSQQQQMGVNNQLSPQSIAQASQQQSLQSSRNTLAPMKWPVHLVNQNMTAIKPMGRPILKGPLPSQPSSQQHQSQQQMQQLSQMMFSKLDFQQVQQRLKNNQAHVLSQSTPPFSHNAISSQQTQNHSNIITHVQQQHQMYQHQQRALALQRHQQQQQQQQQLHLQQQLHKQHQQQQTMNTLNRNNCMPSPLPSDVNTVPNNVAAAAGATSVSVINYRDGGLSPTSNQLAQWFSPELLAQASAGKLPLLNMNQTLSLEEFEKNMQHSSTTVHN